MHWGCENWALLHISGMLALSTGLRLWGCTERELFYNSRLLMRNCNCVLGNNMGCQKLCARKNASLIDAIKVMCGYLLCESQEQGLILHPLKIQVGVRVQDLKALEQLIIQPLNESHQVTPYLKART